MLRQRESVCVCLCACVFLWGEGDPSSRPMPLLFQRCLSPPAKEGNKEVQRNGDSYLVQI